MNFKRKFGRKERSALDDGNLIVYAESCCRLRRRRRRRRLLIPKGTGQTANRVSRRHLVSNVSFSWLSYSLLLLSPTLDLNKSLYIFSIYLAVLVVDVATTPSRPTCAPL